MLQFMPVHSYYYIECFDYKRKADFCVQLGKVQKCWRCLLHQF